MIGTDPEVTDRAPSLADPAMSNSALEKIFGKISAQEKRTARAAIRYANSRDVSKDPRWAIADPDMPAQSLRLIFGEVTNSEMLTAREAIRYANSERQKNI